MMNKRLTQITIALAILGLLVSIYMTIYKVTLNSKMCIGSGGCETVNNSIYSSINGIPVAAVGILGYVVLLGILLFENKIDFLKSNGSMAFFGISLIGFFFTLWLIYVEVALLDAYCPFCITSQITMTVIFILSVIRVIRQP
ncbi:MAG: vitamin K epoxide reductase family protein [Anaerolineales bacterium]|nr:vitamin K epoxide reductase family protein [Anaerolineales bacterium]